MKSRDEIIPGKDWEFNKEVTDVFEDMLRRSIPQYDVMRKACADIAKNLIQQGTMVIDLGCSRGDTIAELLSRHEDRVSYWGVDVSEPMLAVCRDRFKDYIDSGVVKIDKMDLVDEFPRASTSLTMSVLTLQFIPVEYRMRIISEVFNNTIKDGAFILVEKVIGQTTEIDRLMVKLYYEFKAKNGYTEEQIQRKRMSLNGVLIPFTSDTNYKMLRSAGFSQIDCFWRWMNFAAWIAIK